MIDNELDGRAGVTRKLFGVDIDDKSYIERIEQAQCSRMSSIFKNQSKDGDDVVPSDKKRELLQAKMEKLRLLVTKNRVKFVLSALLI